MKPNEESTNILNSNLIAKPGEVYPYTKITSLVGAMTLFRMPCAVDVHRKGHGWKRCRERARHLVSGHASGQAVKFWLCCRHARAGAPGLCLHGISRRTVTGAA